MAIRWEKFTVKAQEAMQRASELASEHGNPELLPVHLLSALAAAATAFDIPARQSLMPSLVPAHDFPNAVSLGLIVFNVATIGGPALAGFILAEGGPAIIYAINAASFLAVIGALIAMRVALPHTVENAHHSSALAASHQPGEQRTTAAR